MDLTGRTWRTLVATVRLGRDAYRVVRPARPLGHAPLLGDDHGTQLTVDKPAAAELALAWAFAARSPNTIVYLPLRATRHTCGQALYGNAPLLDLVLMHHRLHLPVSRWKSIRARLPPGRPHTVDLTRRAFERPSGVGAREWMWRDFRDPLRWDLAAHTLFLIGSRTAFQLELEALRELAEEGPAEMAEHPGAHCCAEITVGHAWNVPAATRRPWRELHVEYCEKHR